MFEGLWHPLVSKVAGIGSPAEVRSWDPRVLWYHAHPRCYPANTVRDSQLKLEKCQILGYGWGGTAPMTPVNPYLAGNVWKKWATFYLSVYLCTLWKPHFGAKYGPRGPPRAIYEPGGPGCRRDTYCIERVKRYICELIVKYKLGIRPVFMYIYVTHCMFMLTLELRVYINRAHPATIESFLEEYLLYTGRGNSPRLNICTNLCLIIIITTTSRGQRLYYAYHFLLIREKVIHPVCHSFTPFHCVCNQTRWYVATLYKIIPISIFICRSTKQLKFCCFFWTLLQKHPPSTSPLTQSAKTMTD